MKVPGLYNVSHLDKREPAAVCCDAVDRISFPPEMREDSSCTTPSLALLSV